MAFLSLHETERAIASVGFADGVDYLGSLVPEKECNDAALERAATAYTQKLSASRADVVLAGPVDDCGHIAALHSGRCPAILQSWAFDVWWESEHDPAAAARSARALRTATALFADSDAVLQRCRELRGAPFPKEFVMPWGVELEVIRGHTATKNFRSALGLQSRTIFACTRGLAPIYGTQTLLEAFAEAHRRDAGTALILAGDGPLRTWVEEFIRSRALEKSVFLAGPLEPQRILDLLKVADFYVSCANCDGSSVSLLEAMACGLPVIASDIPGNREWVTASQNGWLAPCADVAAFANLMSIATALTGAERSALGLRNRRIIEAKADWRRNVNRLQRFIAACAGYGLAAPAG